MFRSSCGKIAALLMLLAAVMVGNGCSATRATATYLKNRALDLSDPFPVGAGMGIGASAHATNYLQMGGLLTSRTFFYRARNVMHPINTAYEGGIAPFWYFRDIETVDAGHEGRPVLAGRTAMRNSQDLWHPWYGENWLFLPSREDYARNYDRHLFDFGFSVYGIFGFDITVNPIQTPYEIADFFAGIFMVDLAGDDEVWAGPRLFDTAKPDEMHEDAGTPAQ